MAAIVKYPSTVADQPDERFCGQCGRRCQPLINDNKGFGPCIDGADSVIACRDFRQTIVQSFEMAAHAGRPVHHETKALVDRLGVPPALIEEWLGDRRRREATAEFLRRGEYGDQQGAPFMRQLVDWVAEGHADEKIIALVEGLKVHCDPTEGGSKAVSYLDICDWFARLGEEAREILSDPGDWEFGEAGEE